MRVFCVVGTLVAALLTASNACAQNCPALLQTASRLLLVTVPTLASSAGTLRLFERAGKDAPWRLAGSAEPVMVGKRGLAWGRAFRDLADSGEPVKVEGDKRSPAGIYAIGRPFGFAASSLANYLRIAADSVCVEAPSSTTYNTIVSGRSIGRPSAMASMRATPVYRRGLVVDYPTDATAKAGSCIFIHIWKGPGRGTDGCVVMPEHRVSVLQQFVNKHPSVLALLPAAALGRLAGCLPAEATARR